MRPMAWNGLVQGVTLDGSSACAVRTVKAAERCLAIAVGCQTCGACACAPTLCMQGYRSSLRPCEFSAADLLLQLECEVAQRCARCTQSRGEQAAL